MDLKKIFNAVVVGGITAVGAGASMTVCVGCGGEGVPVRDAGFPTEGPPGHDAGIDAGFPSEGPPPPRDAGFDAGFPSEGPFMVDGGSDAGTVGDAGADAGTSGDAGADAGTLEDAGADAGFPSEGPAPIDGGA